MILTAIASAFGKLDPRSLWRSPVMFVVEIVALLTTVLVIRDAIGGASVLFSGQMAFWLWFTVLFANFVEAVAESRGKAQAKHLRSMRTQTKARRLTSDSGSYESIQAEDLHEGDLVLVEAGELVPGDGDVIEGVASVDESAITGESAPVIRESGSDRSAVTGGTRANEIFHVSVRSPPVPVLRSATLKTTFFASLFFARLALCST